MAIIFPGLPQTGSVDGKLDIHIEKFLTLGELLTHLPTAQAFLDELSQRGWRYYFIDGYGTVVMELGVNPSPYTLQMKEHIRGGLSYMFSVDFWRRTPQPRLKSIINLHRFIVNICSQYYPRAVTVDLTKNEITYVHEALWVTKGKEGKEEAKDVLKLLRWLIEEKKFKLGVGDGKRYKELVTLLGGK